MVLVKFCYIFILIAMKYVISEYVVESSEKLDNPTEIEIEATYLETKNTESDLDFPKGLLEIISKSKPIDVPNTAPIIPKVDDPKDKTQVNLKKHIERIFDNTAVDSIDTEIKPRAPKESYVKSAESEVNDINNDKSEYVIIQSKSKQVIFRNKRNEHINHKVRLSTNKNSERRPVVEESFREITYLVTFPGLSKVEENVNKRKSSIMRPKNTKPSRPYRIRYKTLKNESMLSTTLEAHPKPNNVLKRLVHTLLELKGLDLDTKKLFIPTYLKVQSNKDDELTFSVLNGQQEIEFEPKNVIADPIQLDSLDIPSIGINQRRLRRNVDEPSQINDPQEFDNNTMVDNKNSSIKENTILFFEMEESSTKKDKSNINITSKSASLDPESSLNGSTKIYSETHNLTDVEPTIYKNSSTTGNASKIEESIKTNKQLITTEPFLTSILPKPHTELNSKFISTSEEQNQTSPPEYFQTNSIATSKAPKYNFEKKSAADSQTHTVSKQPTSKTFAITKSSTNNFEDVFQPKSILSGVESSRDQVEKGILRTWSGAKNIADGTVDAANNFFEFLSNSAGSIASSFLG